MELHGGCTEPLEQLLEAGSLVVDPPAVVLRRLIDCIERGVSTEPVRLLLSPGVAESVTEEFLLESSVANAVDRDQLRVRRTTGRCDDRVVLNDDRAAVLVSVEQQVEVLPMDAEPVVEAFHETYEPVWETAEAVSTRAPPRDQLFEEAGDQLSEPFTTQLERAIESASTLEWHGSPTPVELAIAVAARTGVHHYDLCTWAEEAEFTSRSTVARTKQRLENEGLLDVEPVPQDRGRPRQQLLVGDDRVANVAPEDLVPTLRRLAA